MLKHLILAAAAVLMIAGCSDNAPDQAAIDAAVEKALAERYREDAASYRQSLAGGDQPLTDAAAGAEEPAAPARSTEPLSPLVGDTY